MDGLFWRRSKGGLCVGYAACAQLWHMLVRFLQAAQILLLPASVQELVYSGFDAISEGGVQIFFLVGT